MKLVICQDSIIRVDESGDCYKLSMGNDYYKCYFSVADKISACMRTKKVMAGEKKPPYKIGMENFKIISCPSIMSLKGIILNRRKAEKIIEEEVKSCDYYMAMMPSFFADIGCKYAIKYNKPYFVDLGGCAWDSLWNHSFSGKFMAPIQYYLTKKYTKNALYVLYVTREFLQQRYPTSGKTISCSDVMIEMDHSGEIIKKRKDKIKECSFTKIILGTVASLNMKYKGQEFVIKALGLLKKQGIINFEYQLVGGGSSDYLYNIAKKYGVENQIKFLGAKSHKEVFDWLDSIDVYIQPSLTEGLPRALIEALSRGLPAIGSNAGGIPELLNNEMIYSNRGNKAKQISNLLCKLDKDKMLKYSMENINTAKIFNPEVLKKRKQQFLQDFKNCIDK